MEAIVEEIFPLTNKMSPRRFKLSSELVMKKSKTPSFVKEMLSKQSI